LFTVYDESEADGWAARGAVVQPFDALGRRAWEIHPWRCLDELGETDDDGQPVETRPAFLLAYFRERDGYSTPWLSARA
jgi:hypothetical protein